MLAPILSLLGLLVLSAVTAASEVALLSLDSLKLEAQERSGSRAARVLKALRANPQQVLTTLLILNNVVNTAIATLATAITLNYVIPSSPLPENLALPLASLVIALAITVVGDLIPKTVGAVKNQQIAGAVALPLAFLDRLLLPVHWVVGLLATPIVRLLTGGQSSEEAPTREEMRVALTLAQAGGALHQMDALVAAEALHFSTLALREVMTPRVDVTGLPDTAALGEALSLMDRTGFSRLPVYHEDMDEIVGVLLVKDMVRALADGAQPDRAWRELPARALMREVSFYPEGKRVVDALAEIRQQRSHLAVVVDEHGGTAGIVTLEDMVEELIGDIRDESDPDHSTDIVKRGEGYLIVTGRARLDNLPELGSVDLGDAESSSIGGLLMERLDRAVHVGDSVVVDRFTLTALKVHRNAVKLVRIDIPAEPEEAP